MIIEFSGGDRNHVGGQGLSYGHWFWAACGGPRLLAVWQSLVRRGTASKDSTCGTNIIGQLGLQRTTAGHSTLFGDSGVVYRRKMALATTWFPTMAAVAGTRASQRDAVVRRAWFQLSTRFMEAGHHCSSFWWRHYKRIRDSEYCGGSGEAPACGVFGEATRARRSPTADVARPPRVVFSWWRLRGGMSAVRIRWFHPAR